ncbi:ABC transporter substrate-binding protein [Phytohabitans kaempferiae]|uniref:ABC transporter substrate-binding protein n=1 Tax=Phytohabitans kaempferiae TaxID=1620943 RepID=A0ABV6M3U3_9ACTN
MSPRAARIALAATAAMGMLLTGCSSSGASNAPASDVFVVGLNAEPPGLVRAFYPTQTASHVGLAIQESLVSSDAAGDIIPALAESWQISPDGTVYTFSLRKGVKWHDGTPFTSADVAFSLNEVLPLTANGASVAPLISKVETPDDGTVVLTLKSPYAPLLATFTPSDFNVIPKHLYEGTNLKENEYNRKPVGTGPFKFESWANNDIVLVRNDEYWGGKPGVSKLIFRVIPDANAAVLALKTGEIDFLPQTNNQSALDLESDSNVFVSKNRGTRSLQIVFFKLDRAPFNDPAVRKALFTGLDRAQISQTVLKGFGAPAKSSIPSTYWAYTPTVDYTSAYGFDTAKAAAMLDAAGYPVKADGFRFAVTFRYTNGFNGNPELAQIVATNWRDLKIDVKLQQDELAVWQAATFTDRDFDASTVPYDARLDPHLGVVRAYKCETRKGVLNTNPSGYCNAKLDAIFEAAAQEPDQAKRKELYRQAQVIVSEDLPGIALTENSAPQLIRSSWQGRDEFFSLGTFAEFRWAALKPAS